MYFFVNARNKIIYNSYPNSNLADILGLYLIVFSPKYIAWRMGGDFISLLLAIQYYIHVPVLLPYVLPRSSFVLEDEISPILWIDLADIYRVLSLKTFPDNDHSHN